MKTPDDVEQSSAPTRGISEIVKRLSLIVDEESTALKANNTETLAFFSERKNRILLEFNRALTTAGNFSGIPGFFTDVETLQSRLAENKAVLKQQLSAVKEYSAFLEGEARRHETDGTYSKSIGQFGIQK